MAIFYDPKSKQFYQKDEYSIVPDGSKEITLEALEFYNSHNEDYSIDIDSIIDDIITIEKIETVTTPSLIGLRKWLADGDYKIIKCMEYQLANMECPYNIQDLHIERENLREQIRILESGENML